METPDICNVSLAAVLQDEYSQHLRSGAGVSNVARGEEFYQRALDFHTTIQGMTPKEIHDFGLVRNCYTIALKTQKTPA